MTTYCWFWHRWARWGPPQEIATRAFTRDLDTGNETAGEWRKTTVQSRACIVCGEVQFRKVEIP